MRILDWLDLLQKSSRWPRCDLCAILQMLAKSLVMWGPRITPFAPRCTNCSKNCCTSSPKGQQSLGNFCNSQFPLLTTSGLRFQTHWNDKSMALCSWQKLQTPETHRRLFKYSRVLFRCVRKSLREAASAKSKRLPWTFRASLINDILYISKLWNDSF